MIPSRSSTSALALSKRFSAPSKRGSCDSSASSRLSQSRDQFSSRFARQRKIHLSFAGYRFQRGFSAFFRDCCLEYFSLRVAR
jgi:hypothetical protein